MVQTLPDFEITSTWVSLNTLTGIAIGTPMVVQNKGTAWIIFAEGTEPLTTTSDGFILKEINSDDHTKFIVVDSLEIWVKTTDDYDKGILLVQEI